jgi:hypothetical protein
MGVGNELNRRGNLRAWYQPGGPAPNNPLKYAGQDGAYLSIGSVSQPVRGGIDPSYMWNPNQIGNWVNVATIQSPPDLGSFQVSFTEKKGGIPFSHTDFTCPVSFYELVGDCKALSDFTGGWSQYVKIYPEGLATDRDFGDRTAMNEDDILQANITFTLPRDSFTIGTMTFASQSLGSLTGTPVRDIVYGTQIQCGNCGVNNDGTKLIYAVAKGGAAAKPIVYYTLDGGSTWSTVSIAAAANAEDIVALRVIGSYLVAISPAANTATNGGYYYATLDSTGTPGTFTKVTTGFVDNSAPQDAVVVGNTLWICGKAGYIYKVTDVPSGASVSSAGGATSNDLKRIHGTLDVIVAVGASNTVIYSDNQGQTWGAPTNTPTGTLQAISVVSRYLWWVGLSNGTVYYTRDGGGTAWAQKGVGSYALTAVTDIVHATPDVLYIAGATTTPVAKILTSWDGGNTITNAAPRLQSLPTFTGATRLAVPHGAAANVLANNLGVAGTGVLAADGYALLAVANVI